jgi:hypothetical protein
MNSAGLVQQASRRVERLARVQAASRRRLRCPYSQRRKACNLPVQQDAKVELFLNLKTAKALGITDPLPLSGRANEVIE